MAATNERGATVEVDGRNVGTTLAIGAGTQRGLREQALDPLHETAKFNMAILRL
jgi:hypothetical protein